jgi:hypothetical protein
MSWFGDILGRLGFSIRRGEVSVVDEWEVLAEQPDSMGTTAPGSSGLVSAARAQPATIPSMPPVW